MNLKRNISIFFLGVIFLLVNPLAAKAASISNFDGDTCTGNRKGRGYTEVDNVKGKVTQKGKGEKADKPIPNAQIKIYDPNGKLIGEGSTGKDGSYDIDTSLESVEGMTLTFEVSWDESDGIEPDSISGEMTMD
ncbi:MAG: hypothetical protein Tsb0014_30840 [Pleurocapsa sp.]